MLRINYLYLARLLPIRPERYPSLARKQMGPALDLLRHHGLLSTFTWAEGRQGQLQLLFRPGTRLLARGTQDVLSVAFPPPDQLALEEHEDAVEVREIRSENNPGWFLVKKFYQLWGDSAFVRPTPKEVQLADEVVGRHGETRSALLVERAVKRLKTQWPDAKTFGALVRYLPEAEADLTRSERRVERENHTLEQQRREQESAARRAQERAGLKALWQSLPAEEQEAIQAAVIAKQPRGFQKHAGLIEAFCLEEVGRRETARRGQPPPLAA